MQADKYKWLNIKNTKERRRVQNLLAQQRYRRRRAEALRAVVASEYAQDSSPGHSSSLTIDGLEGPRSQESSVISAASTKEGPADPVASAWSEREMTIENSLMAQQCYYPIACSSLNRSVTTSQHCPTGHAPLAPATLLPLEYQYNCGSSIPSSNLVYQAPPSGTQAGADQGKVDPSVSNFAGQFPGNVDFEYQTAYPWFPQGSR